MDWYYNFNGQRTGPISDGELEQLALSGVVRPETLVWHAGLAEWRPFGGIVLAEPLGGLTQSQAAFPIAPHYAGFWIRFVAVFIDGMIMAVVGVITGLLFGFSSSSIPYDMPNLGPAYFRTLSLSWVFNIAVAVAYNAFFVAKYGGTLGKLALGLRVVTPEGGPVSLGQAVGRYFAYWVDGLTLLIGFIIAAFDSQKRALHDYICNTRVIYKNG